MVVLCFIPSPSLKRVRALASSGAPALADAMHRLRQQKPDASALCGDSAAGGDNVDGRGR